MDVKYEHFTVHVSLPMFKDGCEMVVRWLGDLPYIGSCLDAGDR